LAEVKYGEGVNRGKINIFLWKFNWVELRDLSGVTLGNKDYMVLKNAI